jgi:glutamate-ammonia-ligase adenylyltransferase
VIRAVSTRPCDSGAIAADVIEMRRAIATEKGEGDPWDLRYAAGGLTDIEFIAQYSQLIHAAELPEILDASSARVIEKASRLGVIEAQDAEVLRSAVRLYHALTQILRLCLPQRFDPATASPALIMLLARAADVPDFKTLEAFLRETQAKVRACFERILG